MTIGNDELIQLGPRIYYLDSRRVNSTNVSGVYLIIGDGITLIETATTLIAPRIVEAAAEIGLEEADIKRAIVTHVHLDHAGGTGWLVNRLPDLQVYVHERGLRHLHDPSRLIDSATAVYGSVDRITAIHGETLPVPMENLVPVTDAELDIGAGIELRILSAPGHASHHLCVFEPESGCLFSGEALGHNHPETGSIPTCGGPSWVRLRGEQGNDSEDAGRSTQGPSAFRSSVSEMMHPSSSRKRSASSRSTITSFSPASSKGSTTRRIVGDLADLYLEDGPDQDLRERRGSWPVPAQHVDIDRGRI